MFITDGGGDTSYADALTVADDIVLSQLEFVYDGNDNLMQTTVRQRFHDALGTGELGTPTEGVRARVSYQGFYYDQADRLIATVEVGTHGGAAWTRPTAVPQRSDTVLVSSFMYDAAGRLGRTIDPRGIESRTEYDALGRIRRTITHYVDGVPGDDNDIITEYAYNAVGLTHLISRRGDGSAQTTEWVYGVSLASGSGVNSHDWVGQVRWPDPLTGDASSEEQETVTLNALGEVVTVSDCNGTTHRLSYDVLGRLVADAVITVGAGVNGSVRRIEYAYDIWGNVGWITSYDAATGGTIVNQVQRVFNGLGQLISEWQEHGGAVTGNSPRVQYAYSEMAGGANHSRLTSITYPNGRVLHYHYNAGLDDAVSRLSALSDATGLLEAYDYLGESGVVARRHPQVGVDLTYIKLVGEPDGDAGDQYTGLDRFGRVVDQRWLRSDDGSAVERLQYSYDRNGNRLSRTNLLQSALSETYSYDNLNQLIGFTRGGHSRSWDYDAQGNWQSVVSDGSTQTRSHNAQNEITGISGAMTPSYDANGNLTLDETGRQFVYDAWNRLVEVKDAAGATLKSYAYDGLHRRVQEIANGVTTDLYYSAAWQVLEERVGGQTTVQYVWSPVYVDALVLRDRDSDADGTLEERLWVVQDANWNVTALIDNAGAVVERYVYDPFGSVTVLDAEWNERSSGSEYDWLYLHQGGRYDITSGLYHFRYRDYSPSLGRWTSLDPLRYDAGDVNLYRYVFNAPTVYTDPSGQAIFTPLLIIGGAALFGTAYIAWESYQATGNPFNGQIWGAAAEGAAYVGPRVIVNAVCDTAVSTVTLGGVDRLELWPVPPEYRDAYEWGYAGSRPVWELGAAILTRKLPVKTRPYVLYWDAGQNGVLVGRGLVDMPQVTRHGGGTPRLDWSQGMLWHGPTLHNSIDLGAGLLGLGGNTILLRRRPGITEFNPANFIGKKAVVYPHLPAGRYCAIVVDGQVYVARFHNIAWELAGKTGNIQFYGFAEIDAAGRVVRLYR